MELARVAIALLRQFCRLGYRLLKLVLICILFWIAFDFISSAVFPYNIYCSKWTNQRKLRSVPVIRKTSTTCSPSADRRGDHQNVISYSIYGNFSQLSIVYRYLNPFKETVATIPNFYPGWTVRVYHNVSESDVSSWQVLVDAFSSLEHVDLCNASQIMDEWQLGDLFPMTWRFLPLLDQSVDRVMSRDSDSPILPREVDAVNEWLQSDKIFHAMRDHPSHCIGLPLLGGMWGAKVFHQRNQIVRAAGALLDRDHWHEKGCDQDLLAQFLWPVFKHSVMSHDSFCCDYFSPTQPFPTKRIGDSFVGMTGLPPRNVTLLQVKEFFECPESCRPDYGQDWDSC